MKFKIYGLSYSDIDMFQGDPIDAVTHSIKTLLGTHGLAPTLIMPSLVTTHTMLQRQMWHGKDPSYDVAADLAAVADAADRVVQAYWNAYANEIDQVTIHLFEQAQELRAEFYKALEEAKSGHGLN